MDKNLIENNHVTVTGEVVPGFTYSHTVCGEKFYMMNLKVMRMSENADYIPVTVSDRMLDMEKDYSGKTMKVTGSFRSYNKHEDGRAHLVLSVFPMDIEFLDDTDAFAETECNQIILDGYICKAPVYRKTPLGREIADLLVAVNRSYGKSDYLPCICWGRNARYAGDLMVGAHLSIQGRIQSRKYVKKLSETESEERTAYEVSVSRMEFLGTGS